MNVLELNKKNIRDLNVKELECLLHAREVDAFYSACEQPITDADFKHNKSISDGIKKVEDEIFKRNMVAIFGKRDIVL